MKRILLACASFMLAGCVSLPTPQSRLQSAQALAAAHQWQWNTIAAGGFHLAVAYANQAPAHFGLQQNTASPQTASPHTASPNNTSPNSTLTVFIEGDGFAWISQSQPSGDPTPIIAVGLQMAVNHQGKAAYLARPCQYQQLVSAGLPCNSKYWTSARFSEPVIHATNQAITQLMLQMQASHVVLIGYSGGGAVAALVAARRSDVAQLVTIAGNLDHAHWAKMARLTPLFESLNPADYWRQLASIPQIHFVGGKDQLVPAAVARAYAARFLEHQQPAIHVVPEFDHRCCWAENFNAIFSRAWPPPTGSSENEQPPIFRVPMKGAL